MKKLGYLLLLLPLLFAFGKNKKPQTSKYLTKNYVKVPAGKVYTNLEKVRMNERAIEPTLDSLPEFYIFNAEITNVNWKEFLYYLKQEGRMEEYNSNILDTTVWRTALAYNEPYVDYYYQHPAYKDYPVVGITLKQAQAYAAWLTEIYALKNQGVTITFSVPTKLQWIRAARGNKKKDYAWDGKYLRNSKGIYLGNFKSSGAEYVKKRLGKLEVVYDDSGYSERSLTMESGSLITAPAESYYPNQYGVYNMSGNVAELVSDDTVAMGGSWNDTGYDVRVESEQPATEPKSTIGFRVVAVIEE